MTQGSFNDVGVLFLSTWLKMKSTIGTSGFAPILLQITYAQADGYDLLLYIYEIYRNI